MKPTLSTPGKLVLNVRIVVVVEKPNDVCVISDRSYGHRAVLKYAANIGAQAIAGRFTPILSPTTSLTPSKNPV